MKDVARSAKETNRFGLFATAIGTCGIAWNEFGIAAIQLPEKNDALTRKRLTESIGADIEEAAPPPFVVTIIKSLKLHLEGRLSGLETIKLDLRRVPPFHRKIYEAARKIPVGTTVTYGQLARACGSPAAARAVGQALARNPFALVVPCHRILGHNGRAVGFSAHGGCTLKQKLLSIEGVSIGGHTAATTPQGKDTSGLGFAPESERINNCPFDSQAGIIHLSKADPKMGRLINRVGPFRLELDEIITPFEALAESIVYQQLTGRAAATIFGRVISLYGGKRLPAPEIVAKTADADFRSCGLSAAKASAIRDLAQRQSAGLIPDLEQLYSMTNEQIITTLSEIRGVGRWTVEMLLIFRLGRRDVLPVNDYGVRKGFALIYQDASNLPTPKELETYGIRWSPYRSIATWYLWRALELPEFAKRKS